MPTYTRDACPVCAGTAHARIGGLDGRRCRLPPPPDSAIVRCKRCRLLFVNPMPHWTDADFRRLYSGDYFAAYRREWLRRRAHDIPERRLARIGRHLRAKQLTLLEIGAGVHAFMARHAAAHGWRVAAQEPSPDFAARLAAEVPGIDVVQEPFLALPRAGRYGVVYADSVLEHVPNPLDYFRQAAALLEPGGVLYFVCPNEFALVNRWRTLRDRFTTGVAAALCPYHDSFHLIGYSVPSLHVVAERTGLRLLECIKRWDYRWLHDLHDGRSPLRYPRSALLWALDRLGLGRNMEGVLRREG